MYYSSAGFFALIIHLIINQDVFRKNGRNEIIPARKPYCAFLAAVTVYYISDILWGLLYEHKLITLVYADTALYFTAMAASILLWTRYVISYLDDRNQFGRLLASMGGLFFVYEMIVLIMNFFLPVMFSFDEYGAYHAEIGRYIALVFQMAMYLMTAVYALVVAVRSTGTRKLRHRAIGLSSIVMVCFLGSQAYFPLLPMYALGCLIASCVQHSFVLENEKEEYRENLETRLQENILKGNYYDLLTGLPGMSYFFELAQKKRIVANKRGDLSTFLYMNLSGMKFYNQSHGFAEGDRILRTFAQLLTGVFGSENCSRFGQDHFVVYTEEKEPEKKVQELFRDWKKQFGKDTPAILVGIYPDTMEDVDISTVCDRAKIACDAVRRTYISSIKYFDSSMFANAERQLYIIGHLDQAISEKWIQVYYQPIVRAQDGRVCDEEALARWNDPERGLLSPAEFIPILEDSKLIYKMDLYVVEQVLEKIKNAMESGRYCVPQSINLSRADFDTCDIVEEIRRRVDEALVPHGMLSIEITESIIGSDFAFIKEQADRFRELGFSVWMDDFGSGYSSLDVLQSMAVDLIKFDMSFMQQFHHGDKSRIILTGLMSMAVRLGIDTICEGVEREDQAEFLRDIGCAKLQGYYFSRPLPLEQLLECYENGTLKR